MVVILIRTAVIFITLTVVIRLMGKRQIGEMQPFEFIVTLIIADLACIPMADVSIPLVYGIVAILGLFFLHQFLSVFEHFNKFKLVISGKPSIVIDKNGVNVKELKKNNMGLEDLMESMRSAGYFSFDSLDYAIFEANGKLSSLENPDYDKNSTGIPLLVINQGKIQTYNLKTLDLNENRINEFLSLNRTRLRDVEVLTLDSNKRAYLKIKGQKYITANCPHKKGQE